MTAKLETGIKDRFEEMEYNTKFRLELSDLENRTSFSDVPFLWEIFHWSDPKSRVLFTFQTDFPETFCKW